MAPLPSSASRAAVIQQQRKKVDAFGGLINAAKNPEVGIAHSYPGVLFSFPALGNTLRASPRTCSINNDVPASPGSLLDPAEINPPLHTQ